MIEAADAALSADAASDMFLRTLIAELYQRSERRDGAPFRGMALIDDAVSADAILRHPELFGKDYGLLHMVGDSRFSTNGVAWTNRRRLSQPGYQTAARSENASNIRQHFIKALALIEEHDARSIETAMQLGSASVFLSIFSVTMTDEDIADFFARARSTFAQLQYRSWQAPDAEERQRLELLVSDLVSRFESALARSPGAAALLDGWARRANSEQFSPLSEFMMNFFAGVETTTSALCWAIDRVGVNEAVQRRICEALQRGESAYLDCFLDETLRYFPPIPFVVRQATADTTLGRCEISAGQLVMVSVVGVHRDPAFWDEPFAFHAAREAFRSRCYDRRAFIPFLTGPRTCGGARLARLELTEGFRAFLERYVVTTQRPEIAFRYSLSLRPAGWPAVSLRRRF